MSQFDATVKLSANNEDLIKAFKNLNTFRDVCEILEITPTHLHYILFKMKGKYRKFSISKKNGGTREICSPCDSLKILQQKLNYIMSLIYKPKHNVHGYVKERGIVTNAKRHLSKNHLLNFDLEDFFPSINLGRIRGVLISFFKMGDDAATIIANICCYDNALPQGAPTSPILSNMICFSLDNQMQNIAKQHSCVYTRYADDITFSTNKDNFPQRIAYIKDDNVILGEKIIKAVEGNGFKVNKTKTRLSPRSEHMEVTGITVNEKLNVKRNYIKKVRAILRCLELNSLEHAQEIFESKYRFRNLKNSSTPGILSVLYGMINYIGLVRGFDDSIFEKLALRYNKITDSCVFNLNIKDFSSVWEAYVWVVEVGIEDDTGFCPIDQGTGFFLSNIGFITNFHVLNNFDGKEINTIYIHRSRYSKERRRASVFIKDKERDIAILKIQGYEKSFGFNYNSTHEIGQNITLLGYPNYGDGDSLYRLTGQIVQYRSHYMKDKYNQQTGQLGVKQERTVISPRIVTGNSGGPVVNSQNEVIGIATKGFENISPSEKDDSTAENIIVKIQDVIELLTEIKEKSSPDVIKI